MKRSPIRKLGKKGREWQAAWKEVKKDLEAQGITYCEFGYEGCFGNTFLTPAHSMKRRNITTPELLREVAIGCQPCHSALELLPEEAMTKAVREAIARRNA